MGGMTTWYKASIGKLTDQRSENASKIGPTSLNWYMELSPHVFKFIAETQFEVCVHSVGGNRKIGIM